jgi:glycosyltransferase involved in cell wall biosynthesis
MNVADRGIPQISVVVPVYNGAAALEELFVRTKAILQLLSLSFEVIFIDDGSTDRSWQVITELYDRYPGETKGYRLTRNSGQQAATLCGLLRASGAWIVTMDDDLQVPPEEIALLWGAALGSEADIVYGTYPTLRHSPVYNVATRIFRSIFRLISNGYPDGSSFRLIRAATVRLLPMEMPPWVFIDPALGWVTGNIATVAVRHQRRQKGRSGYSVLKLMNLALTMLIVYSTFPLRLMIWSGLFTSVLSFGLGLFFLYRKLMVGAQLGFSAIIVTLTLTSGVILLSLGILGEYISRIYEIQTGRRPFTIKAELS